MREVVNVVALLSLAAPVAAQRPQQLSDAVRQYVRIDAAVVALTHVRIIDGTGAAPADEQTIVISGNRIEQVGSAGTVRVPAGAEVVDLSGHTVIPGMVGLHNHMFYYTTGNTLVHSPHSNPRLYLASGVTTIRTTGTVSPYAELNLKGGIERGELPGPRMHITTPYLISPGPDTRIDQIGMHEVATEEDARRVVRYWAEEGAEWVKAYTQITRATLGAVIDEAHKHGIKVTAHLCSVGFREAVALGIDNLEHALGANSEYDPAKVPDQCPATRFAALADLDLDHPDVQATFRDMISNGVAMTSTISVSEQQTPGRLFEDPRMWDAMAPHVREQEKARRLAIETALADVAAASQSTLRLIFDKMMQYEYDFVQAGGLLAAGVDPAFGALAGYGDQRNYELFLEAGFSPEQAVQILSANGAKVLGVYDERGSVTAGKLADLVVIDGNPVQDPSDIRDVVIVFKDGVGYDAKKLIASVDGMVGIR